MNAQLRASLAAMLLAARHTPRTDSIICPAAAHTVGSWSDLATDCRLPKHRMLDVAFNWGSSLPKVDTSTQDEVSIIDVTCDDNNDSPQNSHNSISITQSILKRKRRRSDSPVNNTCPNNRGGVTAPLKKRKLYGNLSEH